MRILPATFVVAALLIAVVRSTPTTASQGPSFVPTASPTTAPSLTPTALSQLSPSVAPTIPSPSSEPSQAPVVAPTAESSSPSLAPTSDPSLSPSSAPSLAPTSSPTNATLAPSSAPTTLSPTRQMSSTGVAYYRYSYYSGWNPIVQAGAISTFTVALYDNTSLPVTRAASCINITGLSNVDGTDPMLNIKEIVGLSGVYNVSFNSTSATNIGAISIQINQNPPCVASANNVWWDLPDTPVSHAVRAGSMVASMSTPVDAVGNTVSLRDTNFIDILVKDKWGNVIDGTNATCKVSIVSGDPLMQQGCTVGCEPKVFPSSARRPLSASFTASWRCVRTGAVQLRVQLNDKHIAGSPFDVQIVDKYGILLAVGIISFTTIVAAFAFLACCCQNKPSRETLDSAVVH